jgi:hypothetical protein
MEKVIKDGYVAVVYSPGFGAGWYTWNQEYPALVFDPTIVKYVEEEDLDSLRSYMGLKFPEVYVSDYNDLTVKWLPEGTEFRIDEYDGNESVVTRADDIWFTA